MAPPPLASKRIRPLLIWADEPSASTNIPAPDVVANDQRGRAVETNGGNGTPCEVHPVAAIQGDAATTDGGR